VGEHREPEPGQQQTASTPASGRRLPGRARRAVGAIMDGAEAAAEPIVDRVSGAIDSAERTWQERPGARVRRVRRMGAQPLPYLMNVHPEARSARPVQVGMRSIDVDDIAGTAVGGGAQRGGDFLPLKQFRGKNWAGRWQRLRLASDRLETLPPIDVVKYADRYWVSDGHNRVGLAKYNGQMEIDANITELVPPGTRRTEPIMSHAPTAAESRSLRTAGTGNRPSTDLVRDEPVDAAGPKGVEAAEEAAEEDKAQE
jgi:hypothetical protein